jgi:hypothetical protein
VACDSVAPEMLFMHFAQGGLGPKPLVLQDWAQVREGVRTQPEAVLGVVSYSIVSDIGLGDSYSK